VRLVYTDIFRLNKDSQDAPAMIGSWDLRLMDGQWIPTRNIEDFVDVKRTVRPSGVSKDDHWGAWCKEQADEVSRRLGEGTRVGGLAQFNLRRRIGEIFTGGKYVRTGNTGYDIVSIND